MYALLLCQPFMSGAGLEATRAQALAEETAKGGNAAIPFVKQAKAALPDELKRHFHKGALVRTSSTAQCRGASVQLAEGKTSSLYAL